MGVSRRVDGQQATGSPRGRFLTLSGATPGDRWCVIGAAPQADYEAVLAVSQVPGAARAPGLRAGRGG
eukprot:4734832-Lingulodinium_polyedra.AAC.1